MKNVNAVKQMKQMTTNKAFVITNEDIKHIPMYGEYAMVVERIEAYIQSIFGCKFKMFLDCEREHQVWHVLESDLNGKNHQVERIGNVYELVETAYFSYENDQYVVGSTIYNGIFAYPQYPVILVRAPIYQAHQEVNAKFIFAPNDEAMFRFLQYVQKKQKQQERDTIHWFVDTEDGLDRSQEKITRKVSREEVILDEEMKGQIYRSIDEFFAEDTQFFKTYDIPYKRGILLYGKPGNGKTTMVKSIAGSIDAPVVYWQISEYTSSYSISEVFSSAAKMAPMVLVIEDIDSLPEHVRSFFLNTLDGAISKEGIFLIGTTNYPEKIDPALMNRAGRFDRAYEIKLPDEKLRQQYLMKRNLQQMVGMLQLYDIVRQTKGFTFAQLNELFVSMALQWHYERKVDVQKVLTDMSTGLSKGQKAAWLSDESECRVGFLVNA